MSAIEKALLEATGQKPQKKGEDRQKYLLRLALASNNDLKEEEWDALEAEAGAQDWVTAAIKADNAKKALADFPDLEDEAKEEDDAAEEEEPEDGDDEDVDEDEPEEGEEEEVAQTKANGKAKTGGKKPAAKKGATKAKAADKAPAKSQAAKKPAGKAARGGDKKHPVSMRRALKTMVVKQPKKTADELIEMLEKKGYEKVSRLTVTTIRADTRDTIKVLVEAGVDPAKVDLGGRAGTD